MITAKTITVVCWLALATACADQGGGPTATTSEKTDAQTLDRIGGVPIGGACATSYELTDQVIVNEKDLVSANYSDGGLCRLSHVGAGTLSNSGSIDFTTIPAKGTGTFTLVAANGDRLEGTERVDYDVPNEDGLFSFTGTRTITGGTGRFAGARGAVSISGTGSVNDNTTEQSFDGQIDY
jgi:hypothetical protein